MPYTTDWLIPNEILYVHYSGASTADELRECLLKLHDMIESSPRHFVHVISDVGDVEATVPVMESLRIVRQVGDHPRSGWSLNIREKSPVVKMGSAIGSSVLNLRFRAFATLDQALNHLKEFDDVLSWDKLRTEVPRTSQS